MGTTVNTLNPVWVLEINRPSCRNAIDSETAKNLTFMLQEANANPACHAAILTGVGGWFCAGSDLKELAGLSPHDMSLVEASKAELARTIGEVDIPVIASVSGFALGGGLSIAASCDYVVADPASKWQMPEVANGWLPPWGIEPVIRRCGEFAARRILWGAESIDTQMALALGLVDMISPVGEARAHADSLALRLASLPPIAVRSVKRYQRKSGRACAADADEIASRMFTDHCSTEQARTTLSRFGKAK
jgi:enoyl-CoA hydratase/carnithine racemase